MSDIKNYNKFIDEIIKEVEDELEESTTTGNVDGYQTPYAFGDESEKNQKRKKQVATQAGYSVVDNDVKNIDESFSKPNAEAKKKLKGMYKLPAKQFHQTNDYIYYDKNKKQWYFIDTNGDLSELNNDYYLKQIGDYIKKNNININESGDRDYKAEYQARKKDYYKKYQSSDKAKKYRAELNQYNRKKGTYGNGDGLDASHKGGKIAGFETENKNRSRKEKSRLKKEDVNESSIPKPIQSLIDNMVKNKIQRQTVNIKDKSKHDMFMKDVQPAIDKKLLMVKHNPIKDTEMWISLGPESQKLIESLNEATSLIDMFRELQSFSAAGVTSDDIKKASLPQNKKINVNNNAKFKSLVKNWSRGEYDESPDLLVQSLRHIIGESKQPKRTNRWLELKNDESMHGHKKLAVGLKELKYQLAEVEKFLGWYNKLKNINELDSDNYWKRTNNNIYKIKERLINIVKKIQEIEK